MKVAGWDLPPQVPTRQATYGVHRARTELGLRHLLWQARGAPIIAVLPEELARRIRQAPDLLRRARNQRVHSLQVTDVLERCLRSTATRGGLLSWALSRITQTLVDECGKYDRLKRERDDWESDDPKIGEHDAELKTMRDFIRVQAEAMVSIAEKARLNILKEEFADI